MNRKINTLIIIVVVAVLAILGPIIINLSYVHSGENPITTVWDGADFLGYYGSVLGGLIVFVALYITIHNEKKTKREERILDARVFITVNPDIVFYTYKDFENYAKEIGAYRSYGYPQWEHVKNESFFYDEEFDYITEYGNYKLKPRELKYTEEIIGNGIIRATPHIANSPKPRILAVLVENAFDKPVLNFGYEIDVEYKDKNGNVAPKHYGKSIIKVINPGMKAFFLLPANFNDNLISVKNINISYLTTAGESVCYSFEQINDDVYEMYKINGEEKYLSKRDKNNSSIYFDIRKNREGTTNE